MSFFKSLFHLWIKNSAKKELQETYSEIERMAYLLREILSELREIQDNLVRTKLEHVKYFPQRITGKISLEKTLFVKESLIPGLERLVNDASKKFFEADESIKESGPIDPIERIELKKIKDFLEEIQKLLPDLHTIKAIKSNHEKLLKVGDILREVTKISKEFWELEKHKKELAKKVVRHYTSSLIKNIYYNAERHPSEPNLLIYRIPRKKMKSLVKQADRINACLDPNYRVEWRHWWRKIQIPEKDVTTPLKDPHINLAVTLNGIRKEVHLIVH